MLCDVGFIPLQLRALKVQVVSNASLLRLIGTPLDCSSVFVLNTCAEPRVTSAPLQVSAAAGRVVSVAKR